MASSRESLNPYSNFSRDWKVARGKFGDISLSFWKSVLIQASSEIVLKPIAASAAGLLRVTTSPGNPVKTGNSRGRWVASASNSGHPEEDQRGDASDPSTFIDKVRSPIIAQGDIPGVFFLTNNASYIEFLEGGGSRRQAPDGFVKIVLSEAAVIGEFVKKEFEGGVI